jgi:hypothetical protein
VIELVPTFSVEVAKLAEPPLKVPAHERNGFSIRRGTDAGRDFCREDHRLPILGRIE